jgi:hypothetical protein
MAKLSQTYLYNGKRYGPGDNVDVPKDFPDVSAHEKAFKARQEASAGIRTISMAGSKGGAENSGDDNLTEQGLGVRAEPIGESGAFTPLRDGAPAVNQTGGAAAGMAEADLKKLEKADLQDMAAQKGITVTREDGGDGEPTKADYVRALTGK